MLVLKRRHHEGVTLQTAAGERIRVSVVEIRPYEIKLGFEAAASVIIHRDEVWTEIEAERTSVPSAVQPLPSPTQP